MSTASKLKINDAVLQKLYEQNSSFDILHFDFHNQEELSQLKSQLSSAGISQGDIDSKVDELKAYQRLLRIYPDPEVAEILLNGSQDSQETTTPRLMNAAATEVAEPVFKTVDSAHKITAISKEQFVETYAPKLSDNGKAKAEQIYSNATHTESQAMHLFANLSQLTAPHSQAFAVNNIPESLLSHFEELPSYDQLFGSLNYCECEHCKSIFGPAVYFVDLMRIADKYATKPNANTIPQGMKLEERRPDLFQIKLTCENTNRTMPYLRIVNERLEATVRQALGNPGDLYQTLAQKYYPFALPFHLPFERIRIYLKRLDVKLAEIYETLEANDKDTAAQSLGLSPEEWELLTTKETDEGKLKEYYGVSDLNQLSNIDLFCKQTNLKITQLHELLYQNLSQDEITSGLTKQFFINQGLPEPLQIGIEGETEKIKNLSNNTALDQVHRFLRLAAKLGWSYAELDWALHCMKKGAPAIDEESLIGIARLNKLKERLNTTVDAVCALLFDLKTYGVGEDATKSEALFDRLFNGSGVETHHPKSEGGASYSLNSSYTNEVWQWTIGAGDDTNRKRAIRLASGLGLQQDDLVVLAEKLFRKDTQLSLTVENLSALYRHTTLASLVRLPIQQYVKLLDLLEKSKVELTANDIAEILEKSDRLRRSGLNVFELDYIVTRNASPFVNILYKQQDVEPWLQTLLPLIPNTPVDVGEAKLSEQLAMLLGTQSALISTLLSLVSPGASPSDILATFLEAAKKEDAKTIIGRLSRWLVLVQKLRLTNDEIKSIQSHKAAYGINDVNRLLANNVFDIFRLKELKATYGDVPGNLIAYMEATDDTVAKQRLSDLTGQNEEQIGQLLGIFNDSNRIERLYKIKKVLDLIKKTGTDVAFLQSLKNLASKSAKDNWTEYNTVADNLLVAVRARIATNAWDKLYEQIEGEEQAYKRTALIGTAINELAQRESTQWIKNTRNLYEYLLIDVEMSGCAQISYIKEALNALQLYLIRCRQRLEPGVENFAIPDVWWEWMINYRVWEANRKVFLYPENYIDPAYRSSKTKLFNDLENTLKQGDINQETVEAAFKKYLDSFAELAKLKYVDAYYCNISDKTRDDAPTLFLVARTETQPYRYYYIMRESEGTWSEWQAIDATINAEHVSLVYVFNRLFVFWVELKKYDEKTSNEKSAIQKASIKYSFYNFSGGWVQSQTLVEDAVISAEGSNFPSSFETVLPGGLFDVDRLWWKKVYPLKIEKGRYWVPGAGANKFEKVIIFYGPMLEIDVQAVVNIDKSPDANQATVREFEERLYRVLKNFNRTKEYSYSGYLPIFQPLVINDDLSVGFLVNPDEFLVLQKESPISNALIRPEIDRSAGRLNLIPSNQVIYDNYIAAQITAPTPVKPSTKLNANSFVSSEANIQNPGSTVIYNELVNYGYINSSGVLDGDIDFEDLSKDVNELLQGQPEQEKKTRHVLKVICEANGTPWLASAMRDKNYGIFTVKNHPTNFIFNGEKESFLLLALEKDTTSISRALFNSDTLFIPNSFVASNVGIAEQGSQSIYNELVKSGYLDEDGRLEPLTDIKDLRKDLNDILQGQPGNADKVTAVVNILTHRPIFKKDAFKESSVGIEDKGSEAIYNQLVNYGYLDKNGRLDVDIDFYDLVKDVNDLLLGQPDQDKKVRHVVDTLYQRSFPSSVGFFDTRDRGCGICKFKFEAIRLTTAAVHKLSSSLFTGGIDALLSLSSQQIPVESELPFERFGFTDTKVKIPEAIDGTQVDFSGAYGPYYWELFFHAPLYIGNLLKANQRFQDAQKWFQYVFNPTLPKNLIQKDSFQTSTLGVRDSERIYQVLADQKFIAEGLVSSKFTPATRLDRYLGSFLDSKQITSVKNILLNYQLSRPVARFWQFQPFRNHTLESLREQLQNPQEIAAYNKNPFDPHAIARLRIGAYEKAVVMQYIDNLLQWGDSLFAQYTWESIVAATMLYVYAHNLLGEKPENLGKCSTPSPVSFADIYKKYQNEIPQFLIALEQEQSRGSLPIVFSPINALDTYFGVPENADFIAYWDRVEDRLYKIRHCLNIQGIKQSLALFEPPIDPTQLVRAASAGGDVLALVAQGNPEVPYYRFSYMLEKAKNIVALLSQLGSTLLATLEKKDAEALVLLRSTHEKTILNLTTLIKEKQIEEIKEIIASLQQSQNSAQKRHDRYQALYNENLNALEIADLTLRDTSLRFQAAGILIRGITIAGYLAPNTFGLANGGMQFGDAINAGAQMADGTAVMMNEIAGMIGTSAQYVRRREEWELQRDVAQYEVEQLKKQISANQVRVAILERELVIHQTSIKQADEYEDFIKSRFTNEDLYQWMIGRLSTIYFQTYRMALDMALAVQTTYHNELNRNDQFLQFDYWDSLHRGLLAGEGLMLALNQMEKSYIENSRRDLEIEKTISLLHLDPVEFMKFKGGINGAEPGTLSFELSEKLFDFDFPGHYYRKIKSISVTIPAVVGPYQNINATLVQNSNAIVLKPEIEAVKRVMGLESHPSDSSLRENWLSNQQIALSRGVDDFGLFVLNFSEEKYLPFEGTGAVSKWTLHLPPETNRIDFSSISDIIIKIQYTAKDGGSDFAKSVKGLLYSQEPPYPYTPAKIFDLKQAFAGEWLKFISSPPQGGVQRISFPLTDRAILPNLKDLTLKSAAVLLQTPEGMQISDKGSNTHFVSIKVGDRSEQWISISNNYGGVELTGAPQNGQSCNLTFTLGNAPDALLANGALNPNILLGATVVITYQSNVFNNPN